jgi:endo-alpha-1,4-polygalactosaminidase (GH114 family)
MMRGRTIALFVCLLILGGVTRCDEPTQDWTHYVRVGAYGLSATNADQIIQDARASHVFGIEVDNDVTGRYDSFLDPAEKLQAIHTLAEKAHAVRNKAFVYIAGTECITASAEKSPHSVLKDHPDWLQRKLTGEPAVFASEAAFWIKPGDEDVWISPYAAPWRKIYMERVRQIAATGIDGIYVDIPYWMTHFDGWEDSWASFDDFTIAAFRQKTGLDARKDLKLGDSSDANFRKWVEFRIDTLTEFVREIRENARAVNPATVVIPEIYPGIEQEAARVGADVYEMYGVVDAIAHEYEFGGGDHMASSRSQLDWLLYQVGMLSFRAFAEGKPTWVLNYSWDGDKGVDPREAMKTLAASQVMAGVNFWDAPGHSMAGSNDLATRTAIFQWIATQEKILYAPRLPIRPVGVYFSPASRNFDAPRFLASYRGTLLLLLQNHIEFQIVTPRTLAKFRGPQLILPDVSFLADIERSELKNFLAAHGRLMISGLDSTALPASAQIMHFKESPAVAYLTGLEKGIAEGSKHVPAEFLAALQPNPEFLIEAGPLVAVNIGSVDGKPHAFFVNFAGLVPHRNLVPLPESNARIVVPASCKCGLDFLPFLGKVRRIEGKAKGDRLVFKLPAFDRGSVAWIENTK